MKKAKHTNLIIVILSILLAILLGALIYTVNKLNDSYLQGDSVSKNNSIQLTTSFVREVPQLSAWDTFQTWWYNLTHITDEGDVSDVVEITNNENGTTSTFHVENLLPGDSFKKVIHADVKAENANSITISSVLIDNTIYPADSDKKCDGALFHLVVRANDTEIYEGCLASNDEIVYVLDGEEEIDFVLTVTLDESADREYQNLDMEVDLTFTVESDYAPRQSHEWCPVCMFCRFAFDVDTIAPWCWLVYGILAVGIVLLILSDISRKLRNRRMRIAEHLYGFRRRY